MAEEELLNQCLLQERLDTSYKVLSRKCQINVNMAKNSLASYLSKHPELGALYLISRKVNNSIEYFLGPKLAADQPNCKLLHIYSLHPKLITDQNLQEIKNAVYLSDLSITESDTLQGLETCRIILHPNVQYSKEKKQEIARDILPTPLLKSKSDTSLERNKPSAMPRSSSSSSAAKRTSSTSGKGSNSVGKGSKGSTLLSKGSKSFFENKIATQNISDSSATKPNLNSKTDIFPKSKLQRIPIPIATSKTDKNEEKVLVPVVVSKASLTQSNQIISMFENDEETLPGMLLSLLMRKVEACNDKEFISIDKEPQPGEKEQPEPSPTKEPASKVVKRKKVMKTEHYMEGSYMRTRDVEVWVECETNEEPVLKRSRTKITNPAVSKKKGESKKQQGSITSFFKKL